MQQQNTRWSKKQAREKVRSASNAHLKHSYGHSQMAKFFLKYPPAALDSLLHAWRQYLASSEYRRQRDRSDPRNELPGVIRKQRELKRRCHVLRAQRRLAVRCHFMLQSGKWLPRHLYDLVQRLRNGALDTALDRLTRKHGYGKLHATRGYLSAPTLFDHTSWSPQGR